MKHEAPAFKMIVQDGRLVPAAAWDQERLSTYRNRSTVNVHITQVKNRKLERKYWAILHQVVDKCPVKQRTAEDLHKAIRLKLGIVDAFFTVDGKLRVDLKSTTGMDDPEYTAFYEEAMVLLHDITGVNAETLSAESADVGEDDQESVSVSSADGTGSGETVPSSPAAGQSEPASAAEEAGAIEAADGQSAAPASASLSPDDKAFLVRVFKTMKAAVGPEVNVLKRQALMFTDEIGGKSDLVRAKAKTIREQLQECCGDAPAKGTVAVAKYVAGIIGVDERELD